MTLTQRELFLLGVLVGVAGTAVIIHLMELVVLL